MANLFKSSKIGLVALIGAVGLAGLLAISSVSTSTESNAPTYSIFGTRIPSSAPDSDTNSVELGMRFRANTDGIITEVRFYKGGGNTGTHTASLWTNTGSRLASATFINESASGWQTVRFSTPILVKANTTYVASYHAPRGHYSATSDAFRWNPPSNGPIRILRDGEDGPNSVYAYDGRNSVFPRDTWRSTNYWVDVTFQPKAPLPTTTTGPTTSTTAGPTTTTRPTTSTAGPTTTTAVPTTTTTVPTSTTTTPSGGVSYGWQLTSTNTGLAGVGVNRNSLPAFNGSISAGQTISNVSITSCIDLSGKANVTLDRVWIHPSGCQVAVTTGPGMVIKDSDIDGAAMATGQERYGLAGQRGVGTRGNYTIQRLNITGMAVGMELDSADNGVGTVTDTYIHNMLSTGGAHLDGITRRAGTGPLNVSRSRLAIDYSDGGGTWATGAWFIQDTYGTIDNVNLKDSYLEGNGFPIEIEARFGNTTRVGFNNIRIRPTEKSATYNDGATVTEWVNVFIYSATAPNNAGAAIPKP